MTDKPPHDDSAALQEIAEIETDAEAVDYLVARGLPRSQAEAFVRAVSLAPDDPSWPQKDH